MRPPVVKREVFAKSTLILILTGAMTGSAPEATQRRVENVDTAIVLRDDFERDEPTGWDFTDRAAWRISAASLSAPCPVRRYK